MAFTITGSINSDVWLEYSTDAGVTWTRLTTLFPAGSSIVTNDLPTDIDLKVRLVAFCDEDLISNVLSYDIQVTCKNFELAGGINGRSFDFTNCDGLSQTVVMPQGDSGDFCIRLPFSAEGATLNGECT